MKLEEIGYAIKNLMHRKTRSWLTVLSILMGIAAIFTLTSFGLGIQNYVNVLAEEAGADKLFIQAAGFSAPGTDDSFSLSSDDIDFVRKIRGVAKAEGLYMKVAEIQYKRQRKYFFAMGYNPDETGFIFESFTVDIYKGRFLKEGDLNKVLLGYNYNIPEKIFSKRLEVGEKITINGREFEIEGFVTEVGNPQDDSNIYFTDEAMESLYQNLADNYGFVMIQAEKGEDPAELADKIQEDLADHLGVKEGEEEFYVESFQDIIETFGTIINILTGALILIAVVSLIVAGVNIMNTMYTAVLERTKEIGIMKSVGARNSDILFIFVFESGFLGMVGGVVGVLVGYLMASLGGGIAAAAGYSSLYPIFPLSLILGCIAFAFFIGALAGLLPAYRASKLRPTDALRYE